MSKPLKPLMVKGEYGWVEPEFAGPFAMLTGIAAAVKTEKSTDPEVENDNAENKDDNNAEIRGTSMHTDFLPLTSNHLLNFFGQGWTNNLLKHKTGLERYLQSRTRIKSKKENVRYPV